jgi:hypothetical protein
MPPLRRYLRLEAAASAAALPAADNGAAAAFYRPLRWRPRVQCCSASRDQAQQRMLLLSVLAMIDQAVSQWMRGEIVEEKALTSPPSPNLFNNNSRGRSLRSSRGRLSIGWRSSLACYKTPQLPRSGSWTSVRMPLRASITARPQNGT